MLETNYWVSIPMLSCSIPQIINPCTCTSKLCCIYYSGNEAFGINFFCHHTINRRHLFNKLCFINCSWNAIKTKQNKGYLFNEQTIDIIFKKKYNYIQIYYLCLQIKYISVHCPFHCHSIRCSSIPRSHFINFISIQLCRPLNQIVHFIFPWFALPLLGGGRLYRWS